ncbi:hypothetical protein AVEN_75689-1 [Araneus ventricosus]|uniref:Uncharacterized protein n=1 Tax=Araneus ventricosus TaxID=182803 RepID=A0A4Y2VEU8_ARAVE|nr:hypothetical protein AVEN_75689-1 [Araneus ventricosus]
MLFVNIVGEINSDFRDQIYKISVHFTYRLNYICCDETCLEEQKCGFCVYRTARYSFWYLMACLEDLDASAAGIDPVFWFLIPGERALHSYTIMRGRG